MENPAVGAARSININHVLIPQVLTSFKNRDVCILSDFILHFHGVCEFPMFHQLKANSRAGQLLCFIANAGYDPVLFFLDWGCVCVAVEEQMLCAAVSEL